MSEDETEYLSELFKCKKTIIKPSSLNGYGVFATSNITKDEIIEEAVFSKLSYRSNHIVAPEIRQICYTLPCPCNVCKYSGRNFVLSSGNIFVYNSSDSQETKNISFEWLTKKRVIRVRATQNIKAGKELLHYYGSSYTDFNPVK